MSKEKSRTKYPEQDFACLLDSRFRVPGTDIRFGVDPVIGLIPGVGDWLGGAVSIYFLFKAVLIGGRSSVLGRMFINILLDVLIGSIPVIGELFDIYWKANLRNARILKELNENPQKTTHQSRWLLWMLLITFIAIIFGLLAGFGWLLFELLSALTG